VRLEENLRAKAERRAASIVGQVVKSPGKHKKKSIVKK
jgi:hypothetical protein